MEFDSLWARVYEYGLGILLRANGLSASQVEQVITDPHLHDVARGIFRPITSSSLRRGGVRLDDEQIKSLLAEYDYRLALPTMSCCAADDPLTPLADAEEPAKHFKVQLILRWKMGPLLFRSSQ